MFTTIRPLVIFFLNSLFISFTFAAGLRVEARGEVQNQKIYVIDTNTNSEWELGPGSFPKLSPDQTQVAFIPNSFDRISLIDIDGQRLTDVLLLADFKSRVEEIYPERIVSGMGIPIWMPDGQSILFATNTGFWGEADVYNVNIDGSNLRFITSGNMSYDSWPSPLSPDGRKLLISNCGDECGFGNLGLLNLDDGSYTELSERGTDRGYWSPDSRHVAYVLPETRELYVVDLVGMERTELMAKIVVVEGSSFRPLPDRKQVTWSPDGQKIAFSNITATGPVIYEVQLDGTGLREREAHFTPTMDPLTPSTISPQTFGEIKRATTIRKSE